MAIRISNEDLERISAAIRDAESKTSGEIVTVIAERADDYTYIRILWAAVLALLTPAPFLFGWVTLPLSAIYALQLGLFILAAGLLVLTPLGLWTVPLSVRRRRAAALAREQFYAQAVDTVSNGAGMLLFVAFQERYVEILADRGIDERVDQADWDRAISAFTAEVKAGRIADGFLGAVGTCGDLLAAHFPKQPVDDEDLPNHLILL